MCSIDPIYHVYLPILLKVLTGLFVVLSSWAFIRLRKRQQIDQLRLEEVRADGVALPHSN